MTDCVNERQFSAAVIKYLLAMGELCDKNGKARSVDIAARINVSKPSAHSMINNLCAACEILAKAPEQLESITKRLE